MQNIQKNSADNLGSGLTIYFIPKDDVVSIPYAVRKNISSAIELIADKAFFYMQISLDSYQYKEQQVPSDEGNSYPVALSAFVPGNTSDLVDGFDEMALDRFIVVGEDNDGKSRLLGTLNNPMRFKAEFDSAGKTTGLKGWNILFYTIFSDIEGRPPFYLSSFPAYDNPLIIDNYNIQDLLDQIADLEDDVEILTPGIPDMAIGTTFIVS